MRTIDFPLRGPRLGALARAAAVLLAFVACAREARADDAAAADRTLSPYFLVEGSDPALERLPLERTQVRFELSSVIAEVIVRQRYENAGTRPISARYVFPASTRAVVHGMRMRIGDQAIEARVEKRDRAEEIYRSAKQEGKAASLLDEQRPNVFSMQVANIMPGDRIDVELSYTELLTPSEGVYELVYPTVVGPRYAGPSASSALRGPPLGGQPYLRESEAPSYTFELEGRLATSVPIRELSVPSHRVQVEQEAPGLAHVTLHPSERAGGDRDFVLRYRLAGEEVESGLLLYEGDDENFFLLTVQPPRRVEPAALPPREYVFVLDVSGSMHGFPLDTAKRVLARLCAGLRPQDAFNVLLFSGGSQVLWPRSQQATRAHVREALALIDAQDGGGATELLSALQHALALPSAPGTSRTFVVVTDGYIAAEREVFEWIRAHLHRANVFSFGIGTSVNRYLLEGLARAGLGESFVVTDPSEASAAAERFHSYVAAPVLTSVSVETSGFTVYDVEPRAIPDLFAERPLTVFGKWRGSAGGTIRVRGRAGSEVYEQAIDVGGIRPDPAHAALARLWARTRIAEVSDFGFGRETEAERELVTALGLRYNLLTRFTSFVAVSRTVRNPSRASEDVAQPLPLPLGVSDLAVSAPLHGADEPELLLLLAFAALAIPAARRALRTRSAR